MNEFGLIEKIKKLNPHYSQNIVVGIGDDAAVIKTDKNKLLLVTCDTQVENVHFARGDYTPSEIGQRAVAVNVSDIAAMGGVPKHILVSLILPKKTPEFFVKKLYDGISTACKKYKIDVIGGNISAGPAIIVDITMLGVVKKKNLVLRSGAKVGDLVLVTGILGKETKIPIARINEAQILSKSGKITAMIDISDGISSDIGHICTQSNVGVKLYAAKIPYSKKMNYEDAINRGEDYELLFTANPRDAEFLKQIVEKKCNTKISIIGKITKEKRVLVVPDGKEIKLEPKGWDHFQSTRN